MAPKNKFTRQQLIDTAFDITNEEGFENITIRKIADRLGSSIAPIYVNFSDIEELKWEVVKKTNVLYQQMSHEQNTGNAFLDIGVACVTFARKYPRVFEGIILKQNSNIQWFGNANKFALEQMKKEPELLEINGTELEEILLKLQAYQIGLSVLAGNEHYSNVLTDEKIIQLLKEIYQSMILNIGK